MTQPGSAYFLSDRRDVEETHTLSVLVDNEPGVLARVIGLFSGRGYNIESLTVSETEHEKHLSRITIVTTGTPMVLEQIRHQLGRLVPVHRVTDLTHEGAPLERELALVKVKGTGEARVEALRMADAFRAQDQPDQPADAGQNDRLGQELPQDVAPLGPHRLAQPDLPRALGHRHQHDVHDADTAHQQRNAGDDAQESGQHAGDLA